jgi:hypothetical protein
MRALRDDGALPVRSGLLQCRSGWEKGRVEKGVQDARRRIWQSALEQRFGSFAELNVWLATQCIAARSAPHPDYPGMTIAEALEHEQPHLMPMPAPFDGYVEVAGAGVQHLPGHGRPQSLLGAVRVCRASRQRAPVSGSRGDRGRSESSPSIRAPAIAITWSTTGSTMCR